MKHFGAIGALFVATSASAQPAPEANRCNERHPTALGQIACELAAGLSRGPAIVVPSPVRTTVSSDRLEVLSQRLATLLAGELDPTARAVGESAWPQLSRKAGGARVIVVGGEFSRDRFSAVADELASIPRFWERLRKVAPGSRAHSFSSRGLDAELRSFFASVPLVVTRVDKAQPLDEPSIAIACGDADDDGSSEIVSVGRQRVQIGRILKGRYVPFQTLLWSRLADVAPTPLREPLASAVIRAPGTLDIGSSDRAAALRLDSSFRVVARYADRLPWPGSGCAAIDAFSLGADPVACEASRPRPPSDTAKLSGVDALAGVRLVRPDGRAHEILARRRQEGGVVELQIGARWTGVPEAAGAQLALGDLDGDGRPELVSAGPSRDPKADFVRVQSVADDGSLREAFRVPVSSGVQALGICPLENTGLAPIVLATGDGLWVLR